MKLTKGRLIFVLLSLVVIVLLGIMVGLQLLIITTPTATTVSVASTEQTNPPTPTESAPVASATAIQVGLATIAPTALPVEPTATPVAPTLAPPTEAPPTPVPPTPAPATAIPAPPSATPEPPTATPEKVLVPPPAPTLTSEPTIAAPKAIAVATNTSAPPADIRLGETDRAVDCKFATEIVQLFLERQMKLRVARVHFNSVNDLFLALASDDANQKVDLTLCYIDPDDRTYLQQYDSTLLFVASNYAAREQKRLSVMGNSKMIVQLKTQQPCVYNFLKNLDFGDLQFSAADANQWLAQNSERIAAWSQCQ
ncbi:MAG: hypothetical protein NT075_35505 [Chloroflexi bacterium]|nr:hypothetical protein [Chloroflexota bacterium]